MASLKITVRSSANEERTVEVPIPGSRPLGGNTEVREFLAMRARQRKRQAQVRRIKRVSLSLGAVGLAAWLLVPQWRDRGRSDVLALFTLGGASVQSAGPPSGPSPAGSAAGSSGSAASAAVDPSALNLATESEPLSVPAGPHAVSSDVRASMALASLAAAAAPMAPAAPASSTCEDDFAERRWRAAVDSCTRAFEVAPEAALALRVAHAHWSRGHIQPAGTWASRAVELGTADADAYVLIGHAQRRAGNAPDALAAYRQYLRASPRGWHVRTVRSAIRQLRPRQEADRHQQATVEPPARVSVR